MALDATEFAAAMAIYLAANDHSIALRRGLASALPSGLLLGEPYYATDTERLHVGHGDGTNVLVPNEADITRPYCKVARSGTQSINHNTWTAILWTYEFVDASAMHSTVTNTSQIKCVKAGFYSIKATVSFAVNATSIRGIKLMLNGATLIGEVDVDNLGSASDVGINIAMDYSLAVNDYVELYVFQYSGGALNILATNCNMSVAMLA